MLAAATLLLAPLALACVLCRRIGQALVLGDVGQEDAWRPRGVA